MKNLENKGPQALFHLMDIPLWGKKPPRETGLFFQNPLRFAKLWVILSGKIQDKKSVTFQVYQGMLKVLNFKIENLTEGWLKNNGVAFPLHPEIASLMADAINYWQPENVLILGKPLWEVAASKENYFTTYHPQELVDTPDLKRQAYHVLLSIKEILHAKERSNKKETPEIGVTNA